MKTTKKKLLQRGTCLALCASMLLLTACGSKTGGQSATTAGGGAKVQSGTSYTEVPGTVKKTETVYVTMDPNGVPTQKIVTDWLHTDKAGVAVTDKSDLTDIKNVKNNVAPVTSGNQLTWQMETTDLYYQGTTQKTLPLNVSIAYYLDGAPIRPADLAGKSGKVRIEISIKNTEARTVTIDGKEQTMYVPLIALGGMILPESQFQNITMDNGAVIGDGNSQMAVFACVPGLSDSLKLSETGIDELQSLKFPETFAMTADVKDFSLGNMAFAASGGLPDLDFSQVSNPLDELKSSLSMLEDLQGMVEKLDPDNVLRSLFTDPGAIDGVGKLFQQLFGAYRANEALLNVLPKYVTEQNWALLRRLQADVGAMDLDGLLSSLSGDLNAAQLLKLEQLLKAFQGFQDIDATQLTKLLEALGSLNGMGGVLSSGTELLSKVAGHEAELNTLSKLLEHSDELASMFQTLATMQNAMKQQGIVLTEEDIRVMVTALAEKKAMELATEQTGMTAAQLNLLLSNSAEDIVAGGGTVAPQYREMLVAVIHLAAKSNSAVRPVEASLVEKAQKGDMGASTFLTRTVLTAVQKEINAQLAQKDVLIDTMTVALWGLLTQAEALSGQFTSGELEQLMAFAKETMPSIQTLAKELGEHKDELQNLQDLISDPEMAAFLQDMSGKLLELSKAMQEAAGGLDELLSMLDPQKNGQLLKLLQTMPALIQDLKDAAPVLESLNQDLSSPEAKKAMQDAPTTVAALMKIKADLEKNQMLQKALGAVKNLDGSTVNGIFSKLDGLQNGGTLEKYAGMLNGAGGLVARAKAYFGLSDTYRIFTDAPDGMETSLAFIMKTDAIKKQDTAVEAPVVKEETGITAWFKKIFKK